MKLAVLLDRLSVLTGCDLVSGVYRDRIDRVLMALPEDAPVDWRHLAAGLAVSLEDSDIEVLGISGGQGAGKSTLAALVVAAAGLLDRRAVALSLDDFYLTRAERERLGETVHPLLRTRGVPGTHDVALACSTIDRLCRGESGQVPLFDKSVDDRSPASMEVQGPLDLIVLEGWCVGAPPEPPERLESPVNELEHREDPEGVWRRYVNEALATVYPALWERLDSLLYLQVPDMEAVVRWRTEQEQTHPPERRMTADAIEQFVAHYERLTIWMGESVPERADLVGRLDAAHALADIVGAPI